MLRVDLGPCHALPFIRAVAVGLAAALAIVLASVPAAEAQPTVVATAEGQVGDVPDAADRILGPRFESIRGQAGELLLGGIFVAGGALPPPPEMQFLTDRLHAPAQPQVVDTVTSLFTNVDRGAPSSGRSRNAADDGDFVAFSFAVDGALPQTMSVRLVTFDETGQTQVDVPVVENLNIPVPDPSLSDTGVAVDDQGRVTVTYTELSMAGAGVKARRFDAMGNPIGGEIPITGAGRAATDVALLDPAGNRLIIPTSDFATIRGNLLDVSGPAPQVLPDFPISTTPALFANLNTAVASDPESGVAVVAWENLSALQGDPVNVYARRFDAMGNPVGNDFRVNTTTANAQGQPAVAVGPGGVSTVVWAGDAGVLGDELDVFAQTYGADGSPIGGEIRVNTVTEDVQDRPAVRFLPEPDTQGRPQFVVAWRDVGQPDGSAARGTGRSYRCFSIEGLGDPSAIFADGFESGDTSSWSATNPNP